MVTLQPGVNIVCCYPTYKLETLCSECAVEDVVALWFMIGHSFKYVVVFVLSS